MDDSIRTFPHAAHFVSLLIPQSPSHHARRKMLDTLESFPTPARRKAMDLNRHLSRIGGQLAGPSGGNLGPTLNQRHLTPKVARLLVFSHLQLKPRAKSRNCGIPLGVKLGTGVRARKSWGSAIIPKIPLRGPPELQLTVKSRAFGGNGGNWKLVRRVRPPRDAR